MSAGGKKIHTSVLLAEVLDHLQPHPGGVYVDGTLGLGGHTEAILEKSNPDGKVVAFEWDENAIALSRQRLRKYEERLTVVRRNFAEIDLGLAEVGCEKVDGLLIDIGLSSLQLDQGERGFSFLRDEPLDMRMDTRREITAAKLLAECSEEDLADILFYYGEEKQARRIAAEIVRYREKGRIETSKQLVEIVARAIPRRFHPKKIHVATRTFQGIRIAINTELENLSVIMGKAANFLRPGARFCVISFHSLEDRIVKRKFRENSAFEVITTRPVVATEQEVRENPRSRSAKLRVAVKKG